MFEAIRSLDLTILQALADARSEPLVTFFVMLNAAGDIFAMLLSTCIGVALLYAYRHRDLALGLFTSMATSSFLTIVLKNGIAEARPDALYSVYAETTYSFPSGHTSAAVAFFWFLAYIAYRYEKPSATKKILIALSLVYPILMAFGRMYLGVHYLSDVLGGFAVGILSVALGVIAARAIRRREASRGAPCAPSRRSPLGGNTRRAATRRLRE